MLKSDSIKSEYRIMAQLFKRSYFLKTICQAIALGSLFLFFQTPTFSSGHPEGYEEDFQRHFDRLDPHTKLNGYTYTRKPKAFYEKPLRFKHAPGARVGRQIHSFPAKLAKYQRDLMVPDVFPARTNTSENKRKTCEAHFYFEPGGGEYDNNRNYYRHRLGYSVAYIQYDRGVCYYYADGIGTGVAGPETWRYEVPYDIAPSVSSFCSTTACDRRLHHTPGGQVGVSSAKVTPKPAVFPDVNVTNSGGLTSVENIGLPYGIQIHDTPGETVGPVVLSLSATAPAGSRKQEKRKICEIALIKKQERGNVSIKRQVQEGIVANYSGTMLGVNVRYIQYANQSCYYYAAGSSSGNSGQDTWRYDPPTLANKRSACILANERYIQRQKILTKWEHDHMETYVGGSDIVHMQWADGYCYYYKSVYKSGSSAKSGPDTWTFK